MHKLLALGGIGILSVGSFISCLASGSMAVFGDILLLSGCALATWGFSYWQPDADV